MEVPWKTSQKNTVYSDLVSTFQAHSSKCGQIPCPPSTKCLETRGIPPLYLYKKNKHKWFSKFIKHLIGITENKDFFKDSS